MVEKSVKRVDGLVSRPKARDLKGVGDLAKDLSHISDVEVAGYLNTTKESLLMKIAWEMMNPEYKKGAKRKPTKGKKKDPIKKTAPSKKASATTAESNSETENKKRLSSYINFDVLDKLFDDESSPKRTKLEEPVLVGDQMENSQQSSEDGPEEDEPVWNEEHSNEDAYGVEEFYGDADPELEDQDEGEDNEDIIW